MIRIGALGEYDAITSARIPHNSIGNCLGHDSRVPDVSGVTRASLTALFEIWRAYESSPAAFRPFFWAVRVFHRGFGQLSEKAWVGVRGFWLVVGLWGISWCPVEGSGCPGRSEVQVGFRV